MLPVLRGQQCVVSHSQPALIAAATQAPGATGSGRQGAWPAVWAAGRPLQHVQSRVLSVYPHRARLAAPPWLCVFSHGLLSEL